MKVVGPRAAVGAWNCGAVWAWGLQQVWLLTSMTAPSICLFLAVIVPEVTLVDVQVATVKVRSCLPVSVSSWNLVHWSPRWQAGAIPIRAPAMLCPCRPQMQTRGWGEPSPSPSSEWCLWRTVGPVSPSRTSSGCPQRSTMAPTSGASGEAMALGCGGGMQLSSCLLQGQHRLERGQSLSGSCLGMSLRDGRGHPVQCSGIADVPVLTGWPATLMNH